MLVSILAALPPTLASLAAWRKPTGALARIESSLDDLLSWQAKHDRKHAEQTDDWK